MSEAQLDRVGLVAIGRNEGERLRACLSSVVGRLSHIVYVDSGSIDGSVQMAQAMGVHVIQLDMSVPFTAARARNVGWQALLGLASNLECVQFVDGDCVVADGWLLKAHGFLRQHPAHAVVCGRRREKFPERSIYNRLCDIEWDTPVGDARSCGGDALMRVDALQQAGGYRDELIAGEEPELCVRLRQAGWRIHRLDAEMTLHDAAMFRFAQWWSRSKRAGHAFAEGAWLHGAPPERHWVREAARAIGWGGLLPMAVLVALPSGQLFGLVLLLAYPVQMVRLRKMPGGWTSAFFLVLGKFPEFFGVMQWASSRIRRTRSGLIEYK